MESPASRSPIESLRAVAPLSPVEPRIQNTLETDIEVADYPDEGYVTDFESALSTSLSSSVRDYVFENNRRYHKYKEGRYLIPNDEPEQEREDMKHAMILNLCDGKLHFAPLNNPRRILDVGTGTGIWAIDAGDEYPEAEIIGIDLSPIQPTWIPPNVRFQVDDAESEWVFQSNSFDLVHIRHMGSAIKDWQRLISQAYKSLRPGGWIELQDIRFRPQCDDGTMPEGDNYGFARFVSHMNEAFSRFDVNLGAVEEYGDLVTEGGFTHIQEMIWKVPIGAWPRDPKLKTVGLYNLSTIAGALPSVSIAVSTRAMDWTAIEVDAFLVDVRRSLMNPNIHSYYTFHSVFGQKTMA